MAADVQLENLFRTHLLTLGAVTGLVGSGASARIRPYTVLQDEDMDNPTILVEVMEEDLLPDLSEANAAGTTNLVIGDVQLRCRSNRVDASLDLAEAVRTNGTTPGTGLEDAFATVSGKTVSFTLLQRKREFTPRQGGRQGGWFDVKMRFIVQVNEAA